MWWWWGGSCIITDDTIPPPGRLIPQCRSGDRRTNRLMKHRHVFSSASDFTFFVIFRDFCVLSGSVVMSLSAA